ncbi:unnamed protein product [Parascedosporium putredinis]|uniref:Uncharacterized protein n=1 Tax=Parascedosporium putredinis TaxID=1442378 RepID=A0A9P1GX22_9PEZI|nr:unnamed protein product [Parascedosporium putredinis]CAI7989362.1 unnamed protein product [Parascedosporium putredinis]
MKPQSQLRLLQLLAGSHLAAALAQQQPGHECPVETPTPSLRVLSFTVIATVDPAVTAWTQILDSVCPRSRPELPDHKPAPASPGFQDAPRHAYDDHQQIVYPGPLPGVPMDDAPVWQLWRMEAVGAPRDRPTIPSATEARKTHRPARNRVVARHPGLTWRTAMVLAARPRNGPVAASLHRLGRGPLLDISGNFEDGNLAPWVEVSNVNAGDSVILGQATPGNIDELQTVQLRPRFQYGVATGSLGCQVQGNLVTGLSSQTVFLTTLLPGEDELDQYTGPEADYILDPDGTQPIFYLSMNCTPSEYGLPFSLFIWDIHLY